MADADSSSALPAPAHPMANPGYGKRSVAEQPPRSADDFAHLPAREASIAVLIDRLPEGAAMSAKALAAAHPGYGQAACLTALRRLSEAGHLRRTREHVVLPDGSRWVTRTYFSRAPRADAWWDATLRGDIPPAAAEGEPPPRPPEPRSAHPSHRPARSPAYEALAGLCERDPRLTLSAADCDALEPLAAEWLARDASPFRFTHALVAGLPPEVHSARGLLRTRLRDKMPPERTAPPPAPIPAGVPVIRLVECTMCGVPGRPVQLPGGLCADCRPGARPTVPNHQAPSDARMRSHVAEMRQAIRAVPRRPVRPARAGGKRT